VAQVFEENVGWLKATYAMFRVSQVKYNALSLFRVHFGLLGCSGFRVRILKNFQTLKKTQTLKFTSPENPKLPHALGLKGGSRAKATHSLPLD
jgi:hypothetical protein